jgi:hypothetical protein
LTAFGAGMVCLALGFRAVLEGKKENAPAISGQGRL